jgi:hypothetical protein
MTAWMDFRALKHSIGMEAVLQHYGGSTEASAP